MPISRRMEAKVDVPPGIEVKSVGNTVEVSGPKGKLERKFDITGVSLKQEKNSVIITSRSSRRKKLAAVGAIKSHLLNMIKGLTEGFTYKLQVVFAHFPITVKVEGKRVLIHNFLGERTPRVSKIVGDTEVEVDGDEITVRGLDKEQVGQTALNIEQATYIKRRDPRVFQDGCYIVSKK